MNRKLEKLLNKKSKRVIGLISGTSLDGIDAVLMNLTGKGTSTKIKVIDFITHPIPNDIKKTVFRNSDKSTARIEDITRLNVIIGALFADAVLKLLNRNRLNSGKVDLVGSHGQTIHHLPDSEPYLGYKVKSTMQIGDPAIIANLTGITTVGDFRIADCAVGGDGAPLVPFLDYILFTHKTRNRALLNVGGISNITVLPSNVKKENVIAFDTGPGNMLIDGMMYHLFRKPIDKNGMTAKKGNVNAELFNFLLEDNYYKLTPPKSTGREHYGKELQKKLLKMFKGMNKFDMIRTVTEFTAYTIWYNIKNFAESKTQIDELIVSGGGAENPVLMKLLKSYLKEAHVRKMKDYGITTANKEAILFAVLANECILGNPANLRSVTGSARDVILGKISLTL